MANAIDVELDSNRLRPIDADLQVPCTDKFTDHTGWKPEIPFERTMEDLLDYIVKNLDPDFEGVNLQGANLEGANLRGANLSYVHFSNAKLSGMDLRGANLIDAMMPDAVLIEANLASWLPVRLLFKM